MPVVSSGQISLNDLHIEAGGTSGTECSFNDADIRGLISKSPGAQMTMGEWYGASGSFSFTISSNTQYANLNSLALAAGWDGSSALEATIASGVWIWSDNVNTPAMLVNVANAVIINNGKIIGRGGNGGTGNNSATSAFTAPQSGGPAITISSGVSGVSITNSSGAYIAGGGGGGGAGRVNTSTPYTIWASGGGGGAGGGRGGSARVRNMWGAAYTFPSTNGGGLNATGQSASRTRSDGFVYTSTAAQGGGAGGGAGINFTAGAGGGRILPGVGGASAIDERGDSTTASGGSAGAAGGVIAPNFAPAWQGNAGGGGGGWGASGGGGTQWSTVNEAGASGGAAINDSGNAYTLTNNGTIYGAI